MTSYRLARIAAIAGANAALSMLDNMPPVTPQPRHTRHGRLTPYERAMAESGHDECVLEIFERGWADNDAI